MGPPLPDDHNKRPAIDTAASIDFGGITGGRCGHGSGSTYLALRCHFIGAAAQRRPRAVRPKRGGTSVGATPTQLSEARR